MSITETMRSYGERIESALSRAIPGEDTYPPVIHRAMRYTALGGGKRLRGFLALKSCEAVGGIPDMAMGAACAVEMVHAYSLIHDDLPCMDDDDYRRGRPSNHKVFGEGMAVLAGDALLTQAFEILAKEPPGLKAEIRLQLVAELAGAAGCAGMVGGQAVDLTSEGQKLDLATLAYLHAAKTGALIRAAVCMGARVGGAGTEELRALGDYADSLGMAFQMTDDILDVVGEAGKLGKPVGSDDKNGKATYVSHFGLERTRQMATDEVVAACRHLEMLGEAADDLRELAQHLLHRTN